MDIVQNAIDLLHALGATEPRVAILSAMETVNPDVPSTLEAAALCKMADRGPDHRRAARRPARARQRHQSRGGEDQEDRLAGGGAGQRAGGPGPRAGNMLAKSLTFLAGADAAGIVLGANVPIILTSRADSLITRLASCAVATLVADARRERPAGGEVRRWPTRRSSSTRARRASSSRLSTRGTELEPCCAGRPRASTPRRASRRRTRRADRSRAHLEEGEPLGHDGAVAHLSTSCGAAATATGSSPSATGSCTAARVLAQPTRVDPRAAARAGEADPAGAAAPAAQPRPRSATCSRRRRRCRRWRASTPPSTAASRGSPRPSPCRAITDARRSPLRLPRPVLRVHRRARCRGSTPSPPADGGRRPSGQRREHVRDAGRTQRRDTMGFTAVDGLPMGTRCGALDPGVMLYLMDERSMDARAIENLIYQQSGLLGVSGVSSDMRDAAGQRRAAGAARGRPLRLPDRPRAGLARRRARRARRAGLHRRIGEHAAPIRERVCRTPPGSASTLDADANARGGPRITASAAASPPTSSPPTRS